VVAPAPARNLEHEVQEQNTPSPWVKLPSGPSGLSKSEYPQLPGAAEREEKVPAQAVIDVAGVPPPAQNVNISEWPVKRAEAEKAEKEKSELVRATKEQLKAKDSIGVKRAVAK